MNKMRIFLLTIFLFFGTNQLFSQEKAVQYDKRLLAKYSQEELINMPENELLFLNYCMTNGWYLGKYAPEKAKSNAIEEITVTSTDNLNIFSLGYDFDDHEAKYFHLKDTDKLLVILPKSLLIKEFEKSSK